MEKLSPVTSQRTFYFLMEQIFFVNLFLFIFLILFPLRFARKNRITNIFLNDHHFSLVQHKKNGVSIILLLFDWIQIRYTPVPGTKQDALKKSSTKNKVKYYVYLMNIIFCASPKKRSLWKIDSIGELMCAWLTGCFLTGSIENVMRRRRSPSV